MSEFHKSSQWTKLAKEHKTLRCRKCGTDKHIESDHILPQERFKMFRLWSFNLQYLCGVEAKGCNRKKHDRLDWWHWKTYLLLSIYYMIKGLINGILMCLFAFALVVVFKDFQSGGMDASFSGQLLIDIWELIKELWQWLSQLLQSSLNPKPYQ